MRLNYRRPLSPGSPRLPAFPASSTSLPMSPRFPLPSRSSTVPVVSYLLVSIALLTSTGVLDRVSVPFQPLER